jgi:hypothetical protein
MLDPGHPKASPQADVVIVRKALNEGSVARMTLTACDDRQARVGTCRRNGRRQAAGFYSFYVSVFISE